MKIIQKIYADELPELNQRCLDSVDKFFGSDVIRTIEPKITSPIQKTDLERFLLLAEMHVLYPGEIIVWADWDWEVFESFEFESFDLPQFGMWGDKHTDTFLIVSPNEKWINAMWKIREIRKIQVVYGWHNKVLREIPHLLIKNSSAWTHHNYSNKDRGLEDYSKTQQCEENYFPCFKKETKEEVLCQDADDHTFKAPEPLRLIK
jgi:hypothetical protein